MLAILLAGLSDVSPATARDNSDISYDKLYIGGNYAIRTLPPGSSWRTCQAMCNNDNRCKAWSFIKEQNRKGLTLNFGKGFQLSLGDQDRTKPPRCQLKDQVVRSRSTACCISGKKTATRDDRSQFCMNYAEQAVEDNQENETRRCGYRGRRWHSNFSRHLRFCRIEGKQTAFRVAKMRQNKLRRCKQGRNDFDTQACRNFAERAMDQARFNQKLACGYPPRFWHMNFDRYVKRCRTLSREKRRQILDRREDKIGRCLGQVDDRADDRFDRRRDDRSRRDRFDDDDRDDDRFRRRSDRQNFNDRNQDHFSAPQLWTRKFSYKSGRWSVKKHVRTMADVNGDGRADIVGFGDRGVYVALARRNGFGKPSLWIKAFGRTAGGWDVNKHVRVMADVNGDGRADIVGFGNLGVYVSLSLRNRFAEPEVWSREFIKTAGGWSNSTNVRTMADVNGDGRADIVGFGTSAVMVALARRNGFGKAQVWSRNFVKTDGGWSNSVNVRTMADVNGDGRADIIGFANTGVYVGLARRNGFARRQLWSRDFVKTDGGWSIANVRTMADVNGDSRADIIGFANTGVYVGLARRNGFANRQLWSKAFVKTSGGWSINNHVRIVTDVNGDGRADIVGFADNGVYVSLNQGN